MAYYEGHKLWHHLWSFVTWSEVRFQFIGVPNFILTMNVTSWAPHTFPLKNLYFSKLHIWLLCYSYLFYLRVWLYYNYCSWTRAWPCLARTCGILNSRFRKISFSPHINCDVRYKIFPSSRVGCFLCPYIHSSYPTIMELKLQMLVNPSVYIGVNIC